MSQDHHPVDNTEQIEQQELIDTNEEILRRRNKVAEWRDRGIEPFGDHVKRTHFSTDIIDKFETLEGTEVTAVGRLMTIRGHGKATFAHIADSAGQIQVYAKLDVMSEEQYNLFLTLDIGDIIAVTGRVFRTKRGEITIEISSFKMQAKALRPLPEKWHGLKDVNLRYRQRYLDLIVNPEDL
jgi:lysyl-tRNA synthetase class 2